MKDIYRQYTLEELATDSYFREWVLAPTDSHESFWQQFLTAYPEKKELIEEARALVRSIHNHFEQEPVSETQLNRQFDTIVQQAGKTPAILIAARSKQIMFIRRVAVAAILLIAIGVGLWFGLAEQSQTYATGYGEWKTVELPDGSVVELNANSRITLAQSWESGADRKVWLEGEAFFQVEKIPATKAKFQVITEDLTVEVLGTSFNVFTRGEQTEVFLEEGKIKLEMDEAEEYMQPGNYIAYSREQKAIIDRRDMIDESVASWKEGVLILKNKPTREIVQKLEDIYGLEIEIQNAEILQMETTVRVPMQQIELAIPILENTFGASISRDGNRLIIK